MFKVWESDLVQSNHGANIQAMGCTVKQLVVGEETYLRVERLDDGLPEDWPCVVAVESQEENFFQLLVFGSSGADGVCLVNQSFDSRNEDNTLHLAIDRQKGYVCDESGACRYVIDRKWPYVFRAAAYVYRQSMLDEFERTRFDFTKQFVATLESVVDVSISLDSNAPSVLGLCDRLIHARVAERAIETISGITTPMLSRTHPEAEERKTALASLIEDGGPAKGYATEICHLLRQVQRCCGQFNPMFALYEDALYPGAPRSRS